MSEERLHPHLAIVPCALDLLPLTHEHMDHVGNNGWLKAATGCTIMGHPGRADRVADIRLNAKAIVHAFPESESFDLKTEAESVFSTSLQIKRLQTQRFTIATSTPIITSPSYGPDQLRRSSES